MSKITLNDVTDLTQPTTAAAIINGNSDTIQTAMDNTLSRDGTGPNQMAANIDMNSNRILNLPSPVAATDPIRLQDLVTNGNNITVNAIPAGGTTGESLQKTSNADYAVGWNTSVSSVGLVMPADFTVTNSPIASSGNLTAAWAITPTGTGAQVRTTSPTITGMTSSTVNGGLGFNGASGGTTNVAASATASGTLTLPAATDTLVGRNTVDTLTNKTLSSPAVSGPLTITSNSSNALDVGPNGATNPVLQIIASQPSQATGVSIQGNAAGSATSIVTTSSATNESMGINAKGTGVLGLGSVSTGGVNIATAGGAITLGSGTTSIPGIVTSGTTGGMTITGVTNASNRASGAVGEYITSTVVSGSAVALTTATPANVTSITLTAGDWNVWGVAGFLPANTTSVTQIVGSISTTSGALNTAPGNLVAQVFPATTFNGATQTNCPIPPVRINVSSSTTVYLVAQSTFTVAGNGAFGIINARRAI